MAGKKYAQRLQVAERRTQALRLKIAGATNEQIAAQLKRNDGSGEPAYADAKAVENDLQVMKRNRTELLTNSLAGLRAMEDLKLDELERRQYQIASRPHYHVTATGRVATDAEGKPVVDEALNSKALDSLLRISESRRKLHGLDSATHVKVQVQDDDVRSAVAATLAALGELGQGQQTEIPEPAPPRAILQATTEQQAMARDGETETTPATPPETSPA